MYTDRTPARSAAGRTIPAHNRESQNRVIAFILSASRNRMYKGQKVTTIIPCLNEEQGIEKVLRAMPEFVDEVIVVDNDSTDRTSEVAASLGAKVIREQVRGYGRSYKRGFTQATGDLIVTLDGDHSYAVDAVSYLIEAFLHLEVDFLNASRVPVRDPHA